VRFGFVVDPHLSQTNPAARVDDYAQAMLNKLRMLRTMGTENRWNGLIITGDLFHSKNVGFEFLGQASEILGEMPFPVASIFGNHDLYNDRIESNVRTPLGYLMRIGLVKSISSLGYPNLVGLDFDRTMTPPEAPNVPGVKILVCHAFVDDVPPFGIGNWEFISYGQLEAQGWDIVVAGHDHTPHPVLHHNGNRLSVYRPGAISRGTRHEYNRERDPQVLEIEVSDTWELIGIQERRIPAAPASEIFSLLEIARTESSKRIKEFAESLSLGMTPTQDATDLDQMVESLSISNPAKAILKRYLVESGVLG